jgi:hypothetical protein
MLIDRSHQARVVLLSGLSALLALVSATVSLAFVRIYDGVLDPALLLGSLGFDVMSVLCAVGVIGCLTAIARGKRRWWLPWIGLQGYLLYAYSLYAFGLVFTPLYAAYLAIVGLSAYALGLFGRAVHPAVLRRIEPESLPRRTMSATLFFIAALFAVLWSVMLFDALARDIALPAATVIVLDMAFALPFLVVVGVLLLRRRPMGYLLTPGVFALSTAITLGVAAAELVRPMMGGGFMPQLAMPYLVPGVVCLALAIVAFRRIAPIMSTPTP